MKYGNLHLHSNHSDGGFRPAHMTRIAKSLGYGAIALTDHETLTGIPELMEAAKKDGMEAMSGVEFCTSVQRKEIHITGLDFDYEHPSIVSFSRRICESINERARIKFEDMIERGDFEGICWQDVINLAPKTDFICIDHICHAFDHLGICSYNEQDKVRISFNKCNPKKYYFKRPGVEETIRAIREAGGVAVLAHPEECCFDMEILEEIIPMGINGIEVSHPDLTERGEKLAIEAARKYRLYSSGGTDHTGVMSACGGENIRKALHGVTKDEYRAIKERRLG